VYGNVTLAEIDSELTTLGKAAGVTVRAAQSNHEGELIDVVQKAAGRRRRADHQRRRVHAHQRRAARRGRRQQSPRD